MRRQVPELPCLHGSHLSVGYIVRSRPYGVAFRRNSFFVVYFVVFPIGAFGNVRGVESTLAVGKRSYEARLPIVVAFKMDLRGL